MNEVRENDIVTILLATFNGDRYLANQLESIFVQTYINYRIVVSDDGSSDSTRDILKEFKKRYPEKIEILNNETRHGNAKDNFFFLMQNCHHGYVMFCDQDDVWEPNKIEISLKRMKEMELSHGSDTPILVFTDLKVVDQDLNLLSDSFMKYSKLDGSRTEFHHLLVQNVVTGCTALINSKLNQMSTRYHDSSEILMHDWWMALVASAFGACSFLDSCTVQYRQHGNNAVGAKDSYSIGYILKKLFRNNDLRESLVNTTTQAKQFLATYHDEPLEESILLQSFSKLYQHRKMYRLIFFIKHGILKKGVLRKVAQLLYG